MRVGAVTIAVPTSAMRSAMRRLAAAATSSCIVQTGLDLLAGAAGTLSENILRCYTVFGFRGWEERSDVLKIAGDDDAVHKIPARILFQSIFHLVMKARCLALLQSNYCPEYIARQKTLRP
eukprot:4916478-Pleurochrysis_carterae.AAC.4